MTADYAGQFFCADVDDVDPFVGTLIRLEQERQKRRLILIPSESYAPAPVRQALGSVYTNVYAEGYPPTQMVANDERQTNLIFRTMHNTARVAKNAISDEVVAAEKRGAKFEDIKHLVTGVRGRAGLESGDTDAGIWSAGMVQGLIHDIPTVKELVDRIVSEAEGIITRRMASMVVAHAVAAE